MPVTNPIVATPADSTVYLRTAADTSTFSNKPTKSYNTHPNLTVKSGNRGSTYLRFDISSLSGRPVQRAVLRLYSVDGEGGGLTGLEVDMLPLAGVWDGASVTWDDPVQSSLAYMIGSFSATTPTTPPDPADDSFGRLGEPTLCEVDVTQAFLRSEAPPNTTDADGLLMVSFELRSAADAVGRIDFVSSSGRSDLGPELVVVLAGPTRKPTRKPTTRKPKRKTTRKPTQEPSAGSKSSKDDNYYYGP